MAEGKSVMDVTEGKNVAGDASALTPNIDGSVEEADASPLESTLEVWKA